MFTCKDVSQLLSQQTERKLSLSERIGLQTHLWICANCRRFEQQLRALHSVLKQLPEQLERSDRVKGLSKEARQRIRSRMKAADD